MACIFCARQCYEVNILHAFSFRRFEKNLSGARRQTGGGGTFEFSGLIGGVRLLKALREMFSSILRITPVNKISPKHDPLNARESFYLKPLACDRIGNARENGKLLDVERLIQTAFFQNVCKLDPAKLFVGRHAKLGVKLLLLPSASAFPLFQQFLAPQCPHRFLRCLELQFGLGLDFL
jgi:hypothetical protein